jgi:hypothetical protein
MNTSIKNGVPIYDVEGNRMHVQFPHIIYHNEKYYLYGSNKEFSDGKSGFWHWGIRMYESDDLYNWKDVGIIIPPEEGVPDSPLNPCVTMDAPCIIYNAKNDKWVCWIIDMSKKKAFTLVSDSLFGPYKRTGEGFFPCGFTIGDYDLVQTNDGKGYIYFNHPHTEIVCAELTDDFTSVTGKYNTILKHPESVPFAREAPSHFFRNGKNYLITSGTTAFFPNPSEIAVGERHLGDYLTLGDPHVGDESQTSFHSQVRSIFKHPKKKDLYIALADRWLPDYMHVTYESVRDWHLIWFYNRTPENLELVKKQGEEYNIIQDCMQQDITRAQCVFLPISFDEEIPRIHWRDEWRIEEFE